MDEADFLRKCDAFDKAYRAVLSAFDSEQEDDARLSLVGDLGPFLPADERQSLLSELQAALEEASELELKELLDAGDMVTLPLHAAPGGDEELLQRIAECGAFVAQLCRENGKGPAAVTVARSVVDGFCPMRWQGLLERALLEELGRQFGALDVLYSDELDSLDRPP